MDSFSWPPTVVLGRSSLGLSVRKSSVLAKGAGNRHVQSVTQGDTERRQAWVGARGGPSRALPSRKDWLSRDAPFCPFWAL